MLLRKLLILFIIVCSVASVAKTYSQPKIDQRSYREKADAELSAGNVSGAILLLNRWLLAMPRDAESAVLLSKCYLRQQKQDSAIIALEYAAAAGYYRFQTVQSDTIFKSIQEKKQFETAIAQIKKNAALEDEFPLRFILQEKIGRYRILYPRDFNPNKRYNLVLMLHGNGNDPTLMLRMAKKWNLPNIIFICPEAPYLKTKESLFSFSLKYSAAGEELSAPDSMKSDIANASTVWYHTVAMDAQKFLPLKKTQPIVLGFSQGGYYAAILATKYPQSFCAAVTICASVYPEGKVVENAKQLRIYGIPMLILHGKNDQTVPFQTGELLYSSMIAENVKAEFIPFDGGHWVNDEASETIKKWLPNHFRE